MMVFLSTESACFYSFDGMIDSLPTTKTMTGKVVPTRAAVLRPELEPWREYETLRGGLEKETYKDYFKKRPAQIAKRLIEVGTTLRGAKADWDSAEGLSAGEKSDEFDPTKEITFWSAVFGIGINSIAQGGTDQVAIQRYLPS